MMIDPTSVAFDIDGVVADTMTLFLDIARQEYNLNSIQYSDITSYKLDRRSSMPSSCEYWMETTVPHCIRLQVLAKVWQKSNGIAAL
jgi:uncharacterized HAD superfamily protein